MQGWVEQAVRNLTSRVEYLFRWQQDLLAQLNNMRQQLLAAYQSSGSGGGASANVYYWVPGTTLAAASANPPTGPPSSVSGQTIYQLSSGSYVTTSTNATIYNGTLTTVASGKVCLLMPNGDGTYSVIGQSCV